MVFSLQILGARRGALVRHGFTLMALAGAIELAGCGQRGPLFIAVPPKSPAAIYQAPAGTATPPIAPASAPE